ncbi:histidine--tRNA ligase [Microbacterium testaceum]|uniref:histidine--tRNA ligase n=1 Tax=Microbacterium testaceum TaxID=2033 RepID=UPI0034219ADC
MRDFLPADKARRERVLAVIRERYRAHGFDEIETPVMEEYSRLHAGMGGDNEKLSFSILKRGMDAEAIRAAADDPAELADLGLRYDLTVPLARFYATNRAQLPTVFRAIQIAPVWRAERPQKGRYRQFVQCDIDIIGDKSSRAEAELMIASLDVLDRLGLQGGSIRVNDRRLLDAVLEHFGFAPEERPQVLISIDKLDKIGFDGVVEDLRRQNLHLRPVEMFASYLRWLFVDRASYEDAGAHVPVSEAAIREMLPPNMPEPVVAHLSDLGETVAAVRGIDVPLVFDPFLVRGMGYYTGTIFELAHPRVRYSLGGGGRYDGMIGRFLGENVPAVGFSIGFERIVDLLRDAQDHDGRSVVLVHDRDTPLGSLLERKALLVEDGVRVRLEQRPKNLKQLLDRALADGYSFWAPVHAMSVFEPLDLRPLDPNGSNRLFL